MIIKTITTAAAAVAASRGNSTPKPNANDTSI